MNHLTYVSKPRALLIHETDKIKYLKVKIDVYSRL